MTATATAISTALERLEREIALLSPLVSASISAVERHAWPRGWRVLVMLEGAGSDKRVRLNPHFRDIDSATIYRDSAHEILDRAT